MSLERRVALIEWAQRQRALIVEDDYDGEFRFAGRPLDSLKSLDRAGLVAYVGTFSKTIFPELRIGYAVPPPSLQLALFKAKQIADWHTCTLTQTALARFMLAGDFARHLRRMRKQYDARRSVLVHHLQGELARWFDPLVPSAGIHLTALLKGRLRERTLIKAAAAEATGLYGIASFYGEARAKQGVILGYGGISAHNVDMAMRKLAALLRRVA